jgi:hypothetical protein
VAFDGQSGTVTCSSGAGELYLKQATTTQTLTITSSPYQDVSEVVAAPTQFETAVSVAMVLNPVTLTLNDKFGDQIDAISGLVATIDDVVQDIDANSQITFTPAIEAYVLKVVYQSLELFNAHPAGTTVQVLSVTRVDAANCGTDPLSASFGS